MKFNFDQAKKVIELFKEVADDMYEVNIRSYSGRAMYDKYCVGVVCENTYDFVARVSEKIGKLNERDEDDTNLDFSASDIFSNTHQDSMGLSQIIYWPHIPWVKDVIEDNNDEDDE